MACNPQAKVRNSMETTHTPGTWCLQVDDTVDGDAAGFRVDGAGGTVARLNTVWDRGLADARLIAQAPAMLDALEDAANVLALALALGNLKGQQAEDAYRNARAIIDAAKGA